MEPDQAASGWTTSYLRARHLEGRLYPDDRVSMLPAVPSQDPLAKEWRLRADSAGRLVAYLRRLPSPLEILDVGCGNGWLTARLASIDGASVVGVDANAAELVQARRVFGHRPNLRFVLGDIEVDAQPIDRASVIVLASVAQYIADLPTLIARLRSWLTPTGELHIIDTPFYAGVDVPAARERSMRHYRDIGVPEMAAFYQHHDRQVIGELEGTVLYDPDAIAVRVARHLLRRPRSPFPWIRIPA